MSVYTPFVIYFDKACHPYSVLILAIGKSNDQDRTEISYSWFTTCQPTFVFSNTLQTITICHFLQKFYAYYIL